MPCTCKTMVVYLLAGAALLSACGGDGAPSSGPTNTTAAGGGSLDALACGAPGEITVAAAASLTEAFTEIGAAFEDGCDGSEITFTFDSSGKLAEQLREGAPVDVFASADEEDVERVAELAAGEPRAFARNELVIVTKPGNPERIESLADLDGAGTIALCVEGAPCGRLAARVLDDAEVAIDESRVTRGENAKRTLTAVREGDASAGIVYATDARAAGDAVEAIEIPEARQALATYPVVAIDGPGDDGLARAFVAFLQGGAAQRILADAGFLAAT